MKACPTCQRTYADETLTFCLVDGSILSAPYDPHQTQRLPPTQATSPAPTEVLTGAPRRPEAKQHEAHTPSTMQAPAPFYPAGPQASPRERQGGKSWMTLGLGISLGVLLAAAAILGFVWLSADRDVAGQADSHGSETELRNFNASNTNTANVNTTNANATNANGANTSVSNTTASNTNTSNMNTSNTTTSNGNTSTGNTNAGTRAGGWGPRNEQAGLTGERLTFYPGSTPERCQADCDANPRCRAYTLIRAGHYNPTDPPMCYLMTKATGFTPSPCCISAIKR